MLNFNKIFKINRDLKGVSWLQGTGIEIGAHNLPIEGIRPIYVDRFLEFGGTKCLADIISDASSLPFQENSLDYIASSHLFEHLSNPILTLCEWYKALKEGGIIYMIVPDRRLMFDHKRQRTSLSHLVSDFENNTTGVDAYHINDFIENIDLSMFSPHLPVSEFSKFRKDRKIILYNKINDGREINIHFHVFEKEDIIELVNFMTTFEKTRLDWRIVEIQEKYPDNRKDGFLVVIEKNKKIIKRFFGC